MRKWLLIWSCFCATNLIGQIPGISINEVHQNGKETWVELYNSTDQMLSLESLYLSDDDNKFKKWKIIGGERILPKGFVVVRFSAESQAIRVNAERIEGPRLYLYWYDDGAPHFLDVVYVEHPLQTISLCKFPDGDSHEYHTNKPSPGAPNSIREFISFRFTPGVHAGISGAVFRQTLSNYNTSMGPYYDISLMSDFYLMERYRMPGGIGISRFDYGISSSSSQLINDTTELRETVSGEESSQWIDLTFPFLYNSVRVYRNVYVDFGFIVSLRRRSNLNYIKRQSRYNLETGERIGDPYVLEYSSNDQEGEELFLRAPLKIGVTYALNENVEFNLSYISRNDPDNPGIGSDKRNLKYAIMAGVSYNLNVFTIRSL